MLSNINNMSQDGNNSVGTIISIRGVKSISELSA